MNSEMISSPAAVQHSPGNINNSGWQCLPNDEEPNGQENDLLAPSQSETLAVIEGRRQRSVKTEDMVLRDWVVSGGFRSPWFLIFVGEIRKGDTCGLGLMLRF